MAEEADYIQGELYRDSNFLHDRNTKILYYDCTNYYFETEEESGGRKDGKSKEHRPNPIVTKMCIRDRTGSLKKAEKRRSRLRLLAIPSRWRSGEFSFWHQRLY